MRWHWVASVDTGINASYDFDVMDRLTDIAWENDNQQVIRSFAMTYARDPQQQTDLGTDMIERIDREDGTYRVYVYDSLDRLTGEQHFDSTDTLLYSASYSYDLAGNRTQTVINGVTHTYTLAQTGDRLASWGVNGENTLTYDSAGNVTQRVVDGRPTLDLSWDLEYRLTEVSSGGNPVESYQYDPTGRRIKTVNSGGATWHVYDGAHVIADVDDQGELIRSYTWGTGIDNLLALTIHTGQTSETYYAVTDHLGTVHALVDENGNVAESYRYDAFGNVLGVYDANGQPLAESNLGNRYLFQGREYSFTTELYSFRARWYDPLTGRWLSNDPIGISGGLNQYVAFGNNPVMFVDPWGKNPILEWGRMPESGSTLPATAEGIVAPVLQVSQRDAAIQQVATPGYVQAQLDSQVCPRIRREIQAGHEAWLARGPIPLSEPRTIDLLFFGIPLAGALGPATFAPFVGVMRWAGRAQTVRDVATGRLSKDALIREIPCPVPVPPLPEDLR